MTGLQHFVLDVLIGHGGTADVWGARHAVLGTPAAIKVLRPEYADDGSYREAFVHEARSHARLTHPSIVRVYDVGEVDEDSAQQVEGLPAGVPFIAMQRGLSTLDDALPVGGWQSFLRVMETMLDALAYAHARDVIHRDVKPANLVLVRDGSDQGHYRLVDFGLAHARVAGSAPKTALGPTAGTPLYMSPEQFGGRWRDFGPATDLYAVGCVAYQLLCGELPFEGEGAMQLAIAHTRHPIPELRPQFSVPPTVADWVTRLLQKDPRDRYRCAADALRALRAVDDGTADDGDPAAQAVPPAFATTIVDPELSEETRLADSTLPSVELPRPVEMRLEGKVSSRLGRGLGLFDLVEAPLVGREGAIGTLWELLRQSRREKSPRVAIVRGPGGVGLSSVARWFATRAEELGAARTLESFHSPASAAHEGLCGMLEEHFRTWGLTRQEVYERVESLLRAGETEFRDLLASALTEIIARTRPGDDCGPRHSFRGDSEKAVLVGRALHSDSGGRPRVMVVDDAQWADETAAFVHASLDCSLPWFFVLVVASDVEPSASARWLLESLSDDDHCVSIDLGPPTGDEIARFIGHLVDLDGPSTRRVVEASDGEYLFARQLLGHVLERGLVRSAGQELAIDDDVALPRSWAKLWPARLESIRGDLGLDEEAFDGFEFAALLGRFPDVRELRMVLEASGLQIDARLLRRMADKAMIQRRGKRWGFAHRSLREHFEDRARRSGRWEARHRAIAEMLSGGGRASVRRRLVHHLAEAGEDRRVVESFREFSGDFAALEPRTASELLQRYFQTLDRLGLAPDAEERALGVIWESGVAHRLGQREKMRRLTERAAEIGQRNGYPTVVALSQLRLGQIAMDDGDLVRAREIFEESVSTFRHTKDLQGLAGALFGLGFVMMRLGETDRSLGAYREAARIYDRLGDQGRVSAVTGYIGYTHIVRGEYEAAEAVSRVAIRTAKEAGFAYLTYESASNLGEVARLQGKYGEARAFFQDVIEWREMLGLRDAAVTRLNLAMVEVGARRYDEARELLRALETELPASGMEGRLPLALMARAVCGYGAGQAAEWGRYWPKAVEAIAARDMVHVDLLWLAEQGTRLAVDKGDADIEAMFREMADTQAAGIGRA